MIRFITFDLDDTLWACEPVIVRAEQALHDWFAEHCPLITATYSLKDCHTQRHALFEARPELAHDVTELRRRWLTGLADEFGYSRNLVEHALEYFHYHRNQVTLFADVRHVLEGLRARYRLGAITNGNAQLEVIGIDHLFDHIVYAAQVRATKPNPAIFQFALGQAGVSAAEAVHVGDDPTCDVLGAKRAGLRAIWFNPEYQPWPSGEAPDAVVRALGEVAGVLEGWRD